MGQPPQRPILDVHLLLVRDGQILLTQRCGGYAANGWHAPSGKSDVQESIVDAVVREALEEIGVTAEPASPARPFGLTLAVQPRQVTRLNPADLAYDEDEQSDTAVCSLARERAIRPAQLTFCRAGLRSRTGWRVVVFRM